MPNGVSVCRRIFTKLATWETEVASFVIFKKGDMMLLAVAGDWHANTGYACRAVNEAYRAGVDAIVHVGDFGYWPKAKGYRRSGMYEDRCGFVNALQNTLLGKGLDIYWLPGNHEFWPSLLKFPVENGLHWNSENVCYVAPGGRVRFGEAEWLFLGGAASVDRVHREDGISWFPEEDISTNDVNTSIKGGCADVLVSHEAPEGVGFLNTNLSQYRAASRSGKGWPKYDLDRSDLNRNKVRMVLDSVGAKAAFHGHHHVRYTDYIGDVRVTGLAKDASPFSSNMILVDEYGNPAW